jgi:hypothetical protein
MNQSHVTLRCLLQNLSRHNHVTQVNSTHCSDIFHECVKGILIPRSVRYTKIGNMEGIIARRENRQGWLRVAHPSQDQEHLPLGSELALPLPEAVEIFSK